MTTPPESAGAPGPATSVQADLYGYAAGAEYLHLSIRTLTELVARREIAHLRVGRRVWFTRADLDDYLRRARVPARCERPER